MAKGRASSETDASRPARRARIARRVGSASAAKVASSAFPSYLTMWLSVGRPTRRVKQVLVAPEMLVEIEADAVIDD